MKILYASELLSSIGKRLTLLLVFVNIISVSYAQQHAPGGTETENARVNADIGTIVISKKAQSQISPGVDFSFFTDIPTFPSFLLNDDPSFTSMQDVGMGENNTIWAIAAPESGTGDGNIYYRRAGTSAWQQASGSGTRIDVNLNGRSVLVNSAGALFTWNTDLNTFQLTSASKDAVDVGVSAGTIQSAFVLARNLSGCHTLSRSTGQGFFIDYPNICGTRLDVSPDGSVYVLSETAGQVYKVTFSGNTAVIAQTLPSLGFNDITVGADGKVWAVNATNCYYLENGAWVLDTGSSGVGFGSNSAGLSAGRDGDTPILTLNAKDDVSNSSRGQIIQRREDGTWMNGHKVRQSGNGNSIVLDVSPGTYRIQENPTQPAWKLIGINSAGGLVGTNLQDGLSTFTIVAGQTIHIEYVNAAFDYGDAPASYGTQSENNGAVHQINTALTLGNTIDGDANGAAGTGASGDNNAVLNDEDGVSLFPSISVSGSPTFTNYTVSVAVRNATASTANLCGWIDWNNNGIFESGEGVCTTVAPSATQATLVWPSSMLSGPTGTTGTYARFRLTTNALSTGSATGAATDGEVEDYFIQFAGVLPVTLISFEGSARENQVALKWATAEETNADRFEIQHSTNAKSWNIVGTVDAAGESSVRANYSFDHEAPVKGQNFYRLKMIDQDKTFSMSKIVSIAFDKTALLSVYPNPASNRILITNDALVKQATLYAVSGVKMFEIKKDFQAGIDVSKLSQGIYMLTIVHLDGTVSTQKVLIAR